MNRLTVPPALLARWQALAVRERQALLAAGAALAVLIIWQVAIAPAWTTWKQAPAQLRALETQTLQLQRMATEARELKGQPPVDASQSAAALKAATERLGDKAKLSVIGDRATITLTGATADQLRAWLQEVRQGARGRPVEVQLRRVDGGLSGTVVVSLPGAA
jgi:general secretion pathway protein M